jgi:hypothetical protein
VSAVSCPADPRQAMRLCGAHPSGLHVGSGLEVQSFLEVPVLAQAVPERLLLESETMNSNTMPRWLVALLTVLGVAILGPPALALLLVALGLAFGVGVALLKVSLVALAIAAVVMLVRAMFGNGNSAPRPDSLEVMAAKMEREEQARRAALDRQLAEAVQSSR